MKILAIDLGQKRIGLAISEGKIVSGLETLTFDNLNNAFVKLTEIARRENPAKIVIGLPKGNQVSEDQVRSFALSFQKLIEIPITFTDETLTSKEAENILLNSKLDPRSEKYKQEVDKISAKLILEQYIGSLR